MPEPRDTPPDGITLERLERSLQELIARRWDRYAHALQRAAAASSSGAASRFHDQADAALLDIDSMMLHHRRLTQHLRLDQRTGQRPRWR
ncbi:hypothetical protein [Roseomonas elaeocarpi]|uniref:Uncharacterized protein n=1 Tax=Roseomonas elaeocarpi TaxID=907779 RepID=A0ABV6K0S4_9PROT